MLSDSLIESVHELVLFLARIHEMAPTTRVRKKSAHPSLNDPDRQALLERQEKARQIIAEAQLECVLN
jgi:hypothetical protein